MIRRVVIFNGIVELVLLGPLLRSILRQSNRLVRIFTRIFKRHHDARRTTAQLCRDLYLIDCH